MSHSTRFAQTLAAGALLALPAVAGAQQQQGAPRLLGIDTTNFDASVRPQDDFFRYVNGAWLKKTEIPADASSWGAFNELTEKSRTALHTILEDASKSQSPAGSDRRKVGDLYASYMDSARVESLGITPLKGELAVIAGLTSSKQLPATFAHFARLGLQNPFAVGVGQDPKSSSTNIVQLGQSGLGMPDRDYYLRQDAATAATRAAYAAYITRLFTLAGQADPAGAASRIIALETAIATP